MEAIPSSISLTPTSVSALGESSSTFGASFCQDRDLFQVNELKEEEDETSTSKRVTFEGDDSKSPRNNPKTKKKKVIKFRAKDLPISSSDELFDSKQLDSLINLLAVNQKSKKNSKPRNQYICRCSIEKEKHHDSDRAPQKPQRRSSDEDLPLAVSDPELTRQYIRNLGITDKMIEGLKKVGLHITEV